ncbi:MAG: fatty acid desaturase [Verrucomicrobia bacterium]|nr:fatty acid desaturase [Verrucomicrobiota bacterium]MDA1068810.1 fatty acid desaturase [Verrucomicrobiota bacterium]
MSTTYRPLAEVRKDLRVSWYRCPVERAKLRELSIRSDLKGLVQAGGHLLLLVATGALSFYFWQQQIWVGFFGALFLHGSIGSFFSGIGAHELGHGTVFQSRWLNKCFLYLVSLLSWWDPFDYGLSHTYHHRYTQFPEADRENLSPLVPSLRWHLLVQLFTVNVFTQPGRSFAKGGLLSTIWVTLKSACGVVGSTKAPSREWLQALHEDQPEEFRKSVWWSRLLLLFHGSLLAVSIVSGLWILPIIVSCFAFTANWLRYLTGMTQHCGLRDNIPDFRKSTRSTKLNPLVEFLYWHMNWHTEHHMYAAVPCYNLKKLAKEISEDMPEPRTVLGAWREMRETWERQKADPNYEFDTPVPQPKESTHADDTDELASSIGELAPEGLR